MLLAIDIGNTTIVLGLFEGSKLAQSWRIGPRTHATSDECAAMLRSLFELAGLETSRVDDVAVSCVVPPLLPIFERTCTKLFDREPLVVGPGVRTGMPIRVDNPREVGADRIVNSVATALGRAAPRCCEPIQDPCIDFRLRGILRHPIQPSGRLQEQLARGVKEQSEPTFQGPCFVERVVCRVI